MIDLSSLTPILAIFFILAVASKQFGQAFSKARLPLITGFLLTGMVVGPSLLGMITDKAIKNLIFVDQVSLAVIAFAAGSELHLKQLRNRMRSIAWTTTALVVVTFSLGVGAILLLSGQIPFMQGFSTAGCVAVALLTAAIMVARSPSSAIAIIAEMRAKGPFTQTVLGVTVIMDVVVIVLFAIASSVAASLFSDGAIDLVFVFALTGEIVLSIGLGFGIGKLIGFILKAKFYHFGKMGLVLLIGYGVFLLASTLHAPSQLGFELSLEPLLICMVAGFTISNRTRQHRQFERVIQDVSPTVFVAFFTLTGAALDLGVLSQTWSIALILVAVRLVGIMVGAYLGGTLAGDAPRHNRIAWMGYLTQAGVGLGLAKGTALKFPTWGPEFATMIIAVIIINQIVGPPFFKWFIHKVKEAHDKPKVEPEPYDGVRDAIIFGLENNAYALARQLEAHGWQVKVATRRSKHIQELPDTHGFLHHIPNLSVASLAKLETNKAETVICMFASDEDSMTVSQKIRDNFEIKNVIVRLNDLSNLCRFRDLGVTVIEPTSAMINLFDHFVRAPVATSWIMGMDEGHDFVSLEVRDPGLDATALHELRLPLDVMIMSIDRMGEVFSPHADTELQLGDRVTLVGSPESLRKATLTFDVDFPVTRPAESVVAVRPRPNSKPKKRWPGRPHHPFDWDSFLEKDLMEAHVHVEDKAMLFHEIATLFSQAHGHETGQVEEGLWDRERHQDTLIGDGLAIPHVILDELDKTYLGVVTLDEPIEYRAGDFADVIVFMLGPLEDRHNYLQLLGKTATLCAKADLLDELRKSNTPAQLMRTLSDCNRRACQQA